MKTKLSFGLTAVAASAFLGAFQTQAANFSGNGNSGFGGPIGGGSLTLTDDGNTVSGTITKGASGFNDLLGTYISDSGYRSDEAIAGNATGVQGWNDFTHTAFGNYTLTAVPEPSSVALIGLGGLGMLTYLRRRK